MLTPVRPAKCPERIGITAMRKSLNPGTDSRVKAIVYPLLEELGWQFALARRELMPFIWGDDATECGCD